MTKEEFISQKIPVLIKEGYGSAQAAAIAYSLYNKQYGQQGYVQPKPAQPIIWGKELMLPIVKIEKVTQDGQEGYRQYYSDPVGGTEDYSFLGKEDFERKMKALRGTNQSSPDYEPYLNKYLKETNGRIGETVKYNQQGSMFQLPFSTQYDDPGYNPYGNNMEMNQTSDMYAADDLVNKYPNYRGASNINYNPSIQAPPMPAIRQQSVEDINAMFPNSQEVPPEYTLGDVKNMERMYDKKPYQFTVSGMDTASNNIDISKQSAINTENVTQDINRVNLINPFAGVSMENALSYAGRGFGEKDPFKIGVGTGLSLLKGARTFLSGYGTGKEDRRVQDEYYRKLYENNPNYVYAQQGKEITNAEALTGQYLTDEGQGNINVEGNEFIKRFNSGEVQKVIGEPHLKNGKIAEGVNVNLDEGDKILSDYTKIPAKDIKELKNRYKISLKKGATFADAQKAFERTIKKTTETKELAKLLEKVENQTKNTKDETTKGLNIEALQADIQKSKNKLAMLNEISGEVFEDLFERQEKIQKKGGPGELFDKNGKKVTEYADGTKVAQQGGYMEIAKKYGISPERAQELIAMQQGGVQSGQEEQMEGAQSNPQEEQGEVSPEQIVQTYAQATQQDPQEIVAQLQQMQPEEQQQALMQMAEQLQGGGQEQGGDIMQMIAGALQQGASPEEVMQGLVSQGMPEQEAAQAIEAVMGQNQEQEMAQQGGYKVSQGKNKYKTATREKQSTVEGKAYGAVEPQEALQNLYNNFPDLVETELKDYVTVDKKGNVTFNNKLSFTQQQKQIGNLQGKMNTRMNASADVILNNPELFPSDVVTEAKRYKGEETFLDKTPGAEDPANSVRGFDEKLGNFTSGRYIMGVNLLTPEDLKKASEKGIKTYKQLKSSDFYGSLSPESKKRIDNMSSIVKDSDADFLISEFQPEAAKKQYDFKDKNVEVRNNVRNMFPMLPTDLKLAPSALTPLAKEQINFLRKEATKVTPENMLANQEMMRQTDASRLQQTGMSPQQQEALMASGAASNALAANDAISRVEGFNAQSQYAADNYNLQAAAKEDITNAQFNQDYQNKMLGSMAATERDWRRFYTEGNLQNRQDFKDIENVNYLNAKNEQYAAVPGYGIQFLNNQAVDIGAKGMTTEEYDQATQQEIEDYKRFAKMKNRNSSVSFS
jgi:hypothetical protein